MVGKGEYGSWKFDIKDLIYFEYDGLNLADGVKALALKIGDQDSTQEGGYLIPVFRHARHRRAQPGFLFLSWFSFGSPPGGTDGKKRFSKRMRIESMKASLHRLLTMSTGIFVSLWITP